MAGRIPTWTKVHQRLDTVIERLGEVKATGDTLRELVAIRLELEDLQTVLEELDLNYRGPHVSQAAIV